MKIDKSTTETIEWDIDLCKAQGEIKHENGVIVSHHINILKGGPTSEKTNLFDSNDYEFIKDVHKALGEYVQHVEEIMKGVTTPILPSIPQNVSEEVA